MRAAWFALALLIAVGLAWETRYQTIEVKSDGAVTVTHVWDRWKHRACTHVVAPGKMEAFHCWRKGWAAAK